MHCPKPRVNLDPENHEYQARTIREFKIRRRVATRGRDDRAWLALARWCLILR